MLVDVDMVTVQILYALYVCIRTVHNAYYVHTYSFLPGMRFDVCSQSHEYVVEMVKSHVFSIIGHCHCENLPLP